MAVLLRVLSITPRYDSTSGGDGLYARNLAVACGSLGVVMDVLTVMHGKFVQFNCISWEKRPYGLDYNDMGDVPKDIIRLNYYSSRARESLKASIRRARPDLIHVHGIHQYFTVASLEPLRRFSGPIVLTVHDYKLLCGNAGFFSDRTASPCMRCLQGRYTPPLFERCKRSSVLASGGAAFQMALWSVARGLDVFDAFHCGSQFVGNLIRQNNRLADRVVTVRLPALRGTSEVIAKEEPRTLRLAYVGRMVIHKGPLVFAQAVAGLPCPIDVYGDGFLRSQAEVLLEGTPQARFHGWVDHERLDRDLGLGTIVILPYLANETFCYAAVEAMARGCCVVASARGAIPELITHGINGILIEDTEPVAFRRAVVKLLGTPNSVFQMGRNAMIAASELPTLTGHAKSMIELYEKLIRKKSQ